MRNINGYQWVVVKATESKMNLPMILKGLTKLRGTNDALDFRGRDVGLKSAQLSALVRLGIIKIIGHEDVWVQINEGTKVLKPINIYRFDTNVSTLIEDIKTNRKNKIDGRIARLQAELEELETKRDLLDGIDRAYDKGFADGVADGESGECFNYLTNNPYREGSDEFERYINGYEDGYEEGEDA